MDEFKASWAAREIGRMRAQRRRTKRKTRRNFKNGDYKGFNNLAADEGGGRAGALAARNYLATAISHAREGKTCNGRP